MLLPLGLLSQGGGAGAANTALELISTQVLTGTATQVTFSSIPSTYKHLQLRFAGSTTTNGFTLQFQFNGATSGYSWHILSRYQSSGYAEASSSTNAIRMSNSFNGLSSVASAAIMDIYDYADVNKYKTAKIIYGSNNTGNTELAMLASGLYQSTSAISSIVALANSGSFAIGSRFSIYGVKGA